MSVLKDGNLPEKTDWHEESADECGRETSFWPDNFAIGMFLHLRKIVSVGDGGETDT
jgi:hypothetical protein